MKPFILCLVCLSCFAFSCKKDSQQDIGGKGGAATLRITPQHHGKNIDSCTIFIKYNTLDMPAGGYDDSARCVLISGNPVATFSGLKKGKYYLYGRGYDTSIFQTVDGGAPYTISNEATISINLPVTEDH